MKKIPSTILDELWRDWDAREEKLRAIITERMAAQPPPAPADAIVASYFFGLGNKSPCGSGQCSNEFSCPDGQHCDNGNCLNN